MDTCGTSTLLHFSTTTALASLNEADCLMAAEEAPIFTSYLPASAIHEVLLVSKEARSAALITKLMVCFCPG